METYQFGIVAKYVLPIIVPFTFKPFHMLAVRSLAVASRSRQSEKQPIVDELALIEHAQSYGKEFPSEKNSGDVSRIK